MQNKRFSHLLLCCAALFLSMSQPAFSQQVNIKAGMGVSKHFGHSQLIEGFQVGASYEHEFDTRLTMTAGLYFMGKGWKDKNVITPLIDDATGLQATDPTTGALLYSTMNVSTKAYYLEVPILLNYYSRLDEGRYIVLSAGPFMAIGVGGHQTVRGDGTALGAEKYYYTHNTFSTSGARRFDAGIQLGIGYQYQRVFTVGVSSDLSFLKFSPETAANATLMLTLAYTL